MIREEWAPAIQPDVQQADSIGVGNYWLIFVQSIGRFCLARGGHHASHFNNLNRSICVTRRKLCSYKKSR